MTALMTLDDIEEGTDLALVRPNGEMHPWKKGSGDKLVNPDGTALDGWFFAGYLAEGMVYLADFTPPREGEWFISTSPGGFNYLVLGNETNGETPVAYFSGDLFRGIDMVALLTHSARRERPAWVDETTTRALFAMGQQANIWRVASSRSATMRREAERMEREIDVLVSYSNQLQTRVRAMRNPT